MPLKPPTDSATEFSHFPLNVVSHIAAANVTLGPGIDNTAALNAQMLAMAALREQTILQLPATGSSYIRILGTVTIPNHISVIGAGNDITSPGTTVRADAAGASIVDNASGGMLGHFTIDGNNVATSPFVVSGSGVEPARTVYAQRTVINLDVKNAAQDCVTVLENQNMLWLGCFFQGAGRDNLLLDWETGGHVFERVEFDNPTRHNMRIAQSRVAPRGYAQPTHNEFIHCIWERSTAANAPINIEKGEQIIIRGGVIQSSRASALIDLSNGVGPSDVTLDGVYFSGNAANTPAAIHISGSGNKVIIPSWISIVASPFVFDATAGGSIFNYGETRLGAGVARATAGTPVDATILTSYRNPTRVTLPSTAAAYGYDLIIDGEAGGRTRLTKDGLSVADGTNFSYITQTRRGDGLWGTSVGMVVGGAFSNSSGDITSSAGNILANTIGKGFRAKEGVNGKQGTAVLVGGTVVVSTTSVTATSRIFLTSNTDGGAPGFLRVSARTAGTSFTITSSSGTDTSTVAYQIFEPA